MLNGCKGVDAGAGYYNELRELGEELKKNTRIESLVNFLTAIGNKERLIILSALKSGDKCVCELETIMDKSQPSISFHLKKLEESGLIIGWKKGKFTHYDIVKEQLKDYLALINKELSLNF